MSKLSTVSTSQVKITLPDRLHSYLKSKADKYGLTISAYVKNLIIDDVREMDLPTFTMSEGREKVAERALSDYSKGKTRKIKDVDKYLEGL